MSRNSLLEAGAKSEGEVPASSKEFLDIQATIECGFTLKRVRDMIITYNLSCCFCFSDNCEQIILQLYLFFNNVFDYINSKNLSYTQTI